MFFAKQSAPLIIFGITFWGFQSKKKKNIVAMHGSTFFSIMYFLKLTAIRREKTPAFKKWLDR